MIMKKNLHFLVGLVMVTGVLFGCTPFEKRVDLTYERATGHAGASGELFLARPVLEQQITRLPGGRSVIGTLRGTGTQIVTADDINEWVMRAFMQELYAAGYEIKTAAALPPDIRRGVIPRIEGLSANQFSDGIVITTITEVKLAVDVWKAGKLATTLTVSTGSEDRGLDRSGEFVAESLRKTLQSAMQQLLPGIMKTLAG
jgi:hypothetical protein